MDNPFDENASPIHAARMVWLVDELSNIDPESEKYFADLAERLGIKKKGT